MKCQTILLGLFIGVLSHCHALDTCDQSYMGNLRKGIVTSDNFPFNYRLQRHCRHRIYLEQGIARPNQTVCFTFNRFQVEFSTGCRESYLEFPHRFDMKYCGDGVSNQNLPSTDPYSNIFTENLCWYVEYRYSALWFDVDFVGNFMNYKGYHGTFEIHDIFSDMPRESLLVLGEDLVRVADVNEDDVTAHYSQPECRELNCSAPCENGYIEINGCRTCICRTRIVSNATTASTTAPCDIDQYTCFNRQCIPLERLCDGIDDCLDDSDENYVHGRCGLASQNLDACNFESGECNFELRNMMIARESLGGPRYDHSYGTMGDSSGGHFLFPDYTGSATADITYLSVPVLGTKDRCMSFWYFMSGPVGTLSVYIRVNQDGSELIKPPAWWREDNYGSTWRQGEVDLPGSLYPLLEVRFHTIIGASATSHIGIDDISTVDGKCFGYDTSCSFELSYCGWSLDQSQDALWTRRIGRAPSRDLGTGPTGDAKTGDGYYLYLQASANSPGDVAQLVSRQITFNPDRDNLYCLQLWYHMYGSSNDWLKVRIRNHDNSESLLIAVYGNQGDKWNKLQQAITLSTVSGPFQLVIEGTVGRNESSDIAVDDVIVTQGVCYSSIPDVSTTPRSTDPPLQCPPGYWKCANGKECILESRVCDGRLDCSDLSDEMNCKTGDHLVGVWVGCAVFFCILVVIVAGLLYKVKYKRHHDSEPQMEMPRFPDNFFLDSSSPQVFDEDYEEITGAFPDQIGGSFFHPEPPPPYTGAPSLPEYSSPDAPPPLYSPGTSRRQPPGTSTFTVSVSYPYEPPPSYEIAIVAGPSSDNATPSEGETSGRRTRSGSSIHNRTADSIQSQPQIAIRLASRSASRDTLNCSFSAERGANSSSVAQQPSRVTRNSAARRQTSEEGNIPAPRRQQSERDNAHTSRQVGRKKTKSKRPSQNQMPECRAYSTGEASDRNREQAGNINPAMVADNGDYLTVSQSELIGQGALGTQYWAPRVQRRTRNSDYEYPGAAQRVSRADSYREATTGESTENEGVETTV